MSQRNGDKSRFHRERKQNIHRRKRTRELLLAAGMKDNQVGIDSRPQNIPAGKARA
jgi:hypothetical protein